MKRKPKNKLILSFSLLFFILIAVAGFFVVKTQQSGFGFSTMSINQVDLKSTFEPLNGKAWMVTFRQGGLPQKLIGKLTPSDVSDEYDGKETTRDEFGMELNYENQECQYEINLNNYGTPIYSDFKLVEWTGINQASCDSNGQSKCGSSEYLWGYYELPLRCNAICAVKRTGAIGNFGSPEVNQKFTITTYKNGVKDASKSFETLKEGDIKGTVGSNTYIMWNGNLGSGKSCKDKDPYMPIYKDGKWQTVSESNYDSYKNYYVNRLNIGNDNEADNYCEIMNQKSRSALQTTSFGDVANPSKMSDALLIREVQSPIDYITLTAYIKADWIGVLTPIGKPKLSSPDSNCFGASSDGKVKVVVKNIGEEEDIFDLYGVCQSPFTIDDRQEVSLRAGESRTITLSISADSKKEIKGSYCTIYAKGTQFSDSIKADVCVQPHTVCDAGDKACVDGDVRVCDATGTGYNLVKECDNDCTYDAEGNPYCKEDTPPTTTICAWWDLKCHMKSWFKGIMGFFTPLIIVLSVFIAIISGMVTYKELTNRKVANDKTNRIAGLIFGMGFGFLFYYYIVVVLAIIAVYVLIKIILK